jgi:hypothetical protein
MDSRPFHNFLHFTNLSTERGNKNLQLRAFRERMNFASYRIGKVRYEACPSGQRHPSARSEYGLERQFKQKVPRNQRLRFINRLLQKCGQDFAPGDIERLLEEYRVHEIVKIGRVLPSQEGVQLRRQKFIQFQAPNVSLT